MKKSNKKIKRINLNVPLHLLKEVDKLAKEEDITRTDIFVTGLENELDNRRRRRNLDKFLASDKPIFTPEKNKEIFELGANEWVRRLRAEGNR